MAPKIIILKEEGCFIADVIKSFHPPPVMNLLLQAQKNTNLIDTIGKQNKHTISKFIKLKAKILDRKWGIMMKCAQLKNLILFASVVYNCSTREYTTMDEKESLWKIKPIQRKKLENIIERRKHCHYRDNYHNNIGINLIELLWYIVHDNSATPFIFEWWN